MNRIKSQRTLQRHGVPRGIARAMVTVHVRTGIPPSLICGLIEQETTFRNVWGGDPAPNGGTSGLNNKPVTRSRYRKYLSVRGRTGRGGMQGVGPAQLTWWEFQDAADKLGGCHRVLPNITVGAGLVWRYVQKYGKHAGLRMYNGSGPAAERYALQVDARIEKWHRILTTGK